MPVTIPTLEELLKAGVHFGHRESRRHPKMAPFIHAMRNGVHIVDLEQTRARLQVACDAARALVREGRIILFVGTKDAAKEIIRTEAKRVGMPYVTGRWLGGSITNFAVIGKLIQKYRSLIRSRDTGELAQKYTKHEQAEIGREIARLENAVGGVAELARLPDALFLIDLKEEATAVREAKRKGITTFAVCDTNVNPEDVTYPIPGNDDAVASIRLLARVFTDAVAEGIEERARSEAQAVVAEPTSAAAEPTAVTAVEEGDTAE